MCSYISLKTRAFKQSPEKSKCSQYPTACFSQNNNYGFPESCNIHQVIQVYFPYQARLQVELMAKCFIPLDYGNTYKNMVWLKQSIELQN